MSISILSTDVRVLNMRVRLPFKYGITTLVALPHVFVRVELNVHGRREWGLAADHLPPKWFTKDPNAHFRDDIADMFECIRAACAHSIQAAESSTVYELWAATVLLQKQWAKSTKHPPLLWNFGVSLVERAAIEAFCRANMTTFGNALRANGLGGVEPERRDLLPRLARPCVIARHTVGLIDPITDAEIPPGERLDDGLPQSLEQVIRTYGTRHFKIKLGGDAAKDAARLRALADVIRANAPSNYAFSLDGNENFKSVEPFKHLWLGLASDSSLKDFLSHLLFVEQPFHRDVALSESLGRDLKAWKDRPPMIIDESDGDLDSLPAALLCGYAGTSHKNCKGVFKSVRNAAMLAERKRLDPNGTYILSGEDLANVGPVALLQDLAVAANLGIESVERNGHHYFPGLSMFPKDVQQQTLAAHGDLYHPHPAGFPTLTIKDGTLDVSSSLKAPLGVGFRLDTSRFTPLDDWRFDSLGLT